ncbi:hypothetical protein [Rhodococcus opacus]|uniref:hypothetical protein n=1 Tax=Rhodococcus opacus TaxID=37919 RepID=UPI001C4482EE|nr:hypothetical protein [Rhodococcus opacus]MBV6758373.1 hypothetical protein [Rhodococcus opacus]
MRRLAAIAAATATVTALAACGPSTVTGIVVGKDHDRGRCTTSKAKPASLNGPVIIPKAPSIPRVTVPKVTPPKVQAPKVAPVPVIPPTKKCNADEYELDVRTDSGDVLEVDVDRATFDRIRVGDRYKGRR